VNIERAEETDENSQKEEELFDADGKGRPKGQY
jgi:hypothetical protein